MLYRTSATGLNHQRRCNPYDSSETYMYLHTHSAKSWFGLIYDHSNNSFHQLEIHEEQLMVLQDTSKSSFTSSIHCWWKDVELNANLDCAIFLICIPNNWYSSHIMVKITRGDADKWGYGISWLMNSNNFIQYANKAVFLGTGLKERYQDKTFKPLLLLITCNHFFIIPITFAVCKAWCII